MADTMNLYYFIHLTGRNSSNSGIQRVVRNLGTALQDQPDLNLVPVRWCPELRAVVHAEEPFHERIRLFNGPEFEPGEMDGLPIHLDRTIAGHAAADWLLMPEVPHLGSHDADYPSTHLTYIIGYLRQHRIRTAVVFHDILPLSHFGMAESDEVEALKFIIYANALSMADAVFPVSRASAEALNNWFAQTGVTVTTNQTLQAILLPEEMIGIEQGRFLEKRTSRTGPIAFCMWGSIHRHKNQVAVLEAFNGLCQRRPDLDLRLHLFGHVMGELALRVAHAARLSQGRIRLHGFVDDEAMFDVVSTCRASIFLSLAEGYGLPVAESLWLGKPCITSNLAPMSEIASKGGCLLTNPSDQDDIGNAIELMATNEAFVETLRQELAHRPMETWTTYAAKLRETLVSRPEAMREVLYVEAPALRHPLMVEIIEILPKQLSYREIFERGDYVLIRGNTIEYDSNFHGVIHERVISYGPYLRLQKGRYKLNILGTLEGHIEVRLTLESGSREIGRWQQNDLLSAMEFDVERSAGGFEAVITRGENLRHFKLERLVLERYV